MFLYIVAMRHTTNYERSEKAVKITVGIVISCSAKCCCCSRVSETFRGAEMATFSPIYDFKMVAISVSRHKLDHM